MNSRNRLILSPLFLLIFCAPLAAQPVRISLVPLLSGLSDPVLLTNAKDGSNRRFIIEQVGRIRVLQPGAISSTVFLDITSRVLYVGERGLLGLAFHPQFSSNRRFYVNYTRRPDGATVVAEYRDGVELRILFTVPQPYENHNGGMIEFGPDGLLYIGMGDGGSGNDPQNRAQNLNERLGKMLRINVDVPNAAPEIFAYGFRNPWRFSFDRLTGQLYAGDVGQSAREEIDIVTKGGNYGWRVFEGTFCTGLGPASCSTAGFIPPIAEYVNTGSNGRCAIIGGYVYRGKQASLPYGAYIYGDLCSGEIFMLKDGVQTVLLDTALTISSFGEDESGEIYVLNIEGSIFRLANPDVVNANQRRYSISDSTVFTSATPGSAPALTSGYARIQADPGHESAAGLAIFAYQPDGVLVSETSVPATPAVMSGRLFAEVNGSVNTGIALLNPNDEAAVVSFYVTVANDTNGQLRITVIPPRQQISAFLTEAPFNVETYLTGTFTFSSTVPIAAIGLRGLSNERGDFLLTTLPVFDLAALPPGPATIAHFADGGGWTTQVVIVNPSSVLVDGTVQLVASDGGVIRSEPYTIQPRSFASVVTNGSGPDIQTGSVRVTTGSAFTIFSFRSNGVTVTQAGVPTTPAGTEFRTYVEMGGAIRSGIAIANPATTAVTVKLSLNSVALSATLSIPPGGQTVTFLDELPGFSGLKVPFQGVLDVSSDTPIVVTGLRGHANSRHEFLLTTTAFVPATSPAAAELFFPHFADGGGYQTQFILFGRSAAGTLSFFDPDGAPISLLFR